MRTSISTIASSHLFLLIGGAQAFANPFHRRDFSVGRSNSKLEATTLESLTEATKTVVIATDSEFIKSDPEKRQYRAITLSNQLTVLLASDPTTDVEAASVHVRAGHFDDPANRAGLAHFHEHMLFLGTEKYPEENDYEDFLGKNGGMSNAYTDMEDTNYYFNVSPLDHDENGE